MYADNRKKMIGKAMRLITNDVRRLCIYIIYDKSGIIDRYIGYVLRELKSISSRLIAVCNMPEIEKGENYLVPADEVLFRDNKGFDAGAYKEVLCDYLGWEECLQYDELVLMNDSLFGPFESFEVIFERMDNLSGIDFWGLLKSGSTIRESGKVLKSHIQSFFLVFRNKMFHSDDFRKYWEEMRSFASLNDTVEGFETGFTSFFNSLGFKYDTYALDDDLVSPEPENNYNLYAYLPLEMLRDRRFPFIKKKPLVTNLLAFQSQYEIQSLLDYIDKHTAYDVGMIWENIIRSLHVADLYRGMKLRFIIAPNQNMVHKSSVCFVVNLRQKDNEWIDDIRNATNGWGELVIVSVEGHQFFDEEVLHTIKQNDYVCFLNLYNYSHDNHAYYEVKSLFHNVFENLINSTQYIASVIEIFNNNEYLGCLKAPSALFGYNFTLRESWYEGHVENIHKIISEMNLHCIFDETSFPISSSESFWVRGRILKNINAISQYGIAYLPRLIEFISQDAGYYTGVVESIMHAQLLEADAENCLDRLRSQMKGQFHILHGHIGVVQTELSCIAYEKFRDSHQRTLIYGAGDIAFIYSRYLAPPDFYIVSDDHFHNGDFNHLQAPVISLSEYYREEGDGVVICLNHNHRKEVYSFIQSTDEDDILIMYDAPTFIAD